MNISDSNPIQFWPEDEDVYNDQEVDGIEFKPFIQEFACSDVIRLQAVEAVDPNISLKILDCSDEEIDTLEFVKTSIGGVEGSDEVIENFPLSANDLSDWTPRTDAALVDWYNFPRGLFLICSNNTKTGEQLYTDYAFIPGRVYTIRLEMYEERTGVGTFDEIVNTLSVTDSAFNEQFIEVLTYDGTTPGFDFFIELEFTATEECTRIVFQGSATVTGDGVVSIVFTDNNLEEVTPAVEEVLPTYTIYDISFTPSVLALCDRKVHFEIWNDDTEELLFKSDIIKFSTAPYKTVLLKYKGYKNFDGIYYDGSSEYRWLRLPGMFFHDRNPTEQRAIEQSNARIINTAYSQKKQKQLSISDAPDYMHTKIQSVLGHAAIGSLVLQGVDWTVEEDYELQSRNPNGTDSYPLKAAKIYLTRRNYVKRNAL